MINAHYMLVYKLQLFLQNCYTAVLSAMALTIGRLVLDSICVKMGNTIFFGHQDKVNCKLLLDAMNAETYNEWLTASDYLWVLNVDSMY